MGAAVLSETEKKLINSLLQSPKTLMELFKAGILTKSDHFHLILLKLESMGFLIYEESVKRGSNKSRYGCVGAAKGSTAETLIQNKEV